MKPFPVRGFVFYCISGLCNNNLHSEYKIWVLNGCQKSKKREVLKILPANRIAVKIEKKLVADEFAEMLNSYTLSEQQPQIFL